MSDLVNDYFRRFYPAALDRDAPDQWEVSDMPRGMRRYIGPGGNRGHFPRLVCVDGFSVSVQAHWGTYSMPHDDYAESYSEVELGFPSAADDLITEYAESPETPTGTVYGYVPIEVVCRLIEKHGGIAS